MSEPIPPDNKTRVSPARAPAPETLNTETTRGLPTKPPSSPSAPLSRLGRFEIRQVLGEGAFGCVYLAFDPELERQVAIKVPHRDGLTPAFRERFLREARATATIHHPNVCPVYDVGTDGDLPYIVMHYVVGGTLASVLNRVKGTLDVRSALVIARKLALGMAAAHEQGVIHRDLKPANVLYDKATREVLITDFGLARIATESRKTADGSVLGTPAYMSPEQARGRMNEVGPLSDVYSLGVILYRMLTGDVPFRGNEFEVMAQHWEAVPRPPSGACMGLDPRLDAIVLKALAKAPTARYASAKEFANALAAYLRPSKSSAVIEEIPASSESLPKLAPVEPASAVQTPKPSSPQTAPRNQLLLFKLLVLTLLLGGTSAGWANLSERYFWKYILPDATVCVITILAMILQVGIYQTGLSDLKRWRLAVACALTPVLVLGLLRILGLIQSGR